MSGYISVWELIISVMFFSQPSKRDETIVTQGKKIKCSERAPPTPPR